MKKLLPVVICLLTFASAALPQAKTNDSINRQISALKSEKIFTVSYDQGGNSSKLMAVAENFANSEAERSGVLAMNFAAGFFYAGNALQQSPDRIMLTFWVLGKKPRFAESHDLRVFAGQEILEIGSGRYSARARENMEYLNFELAREDVAKIAAQSSVRFTLGEREFTFTRQHLKIFADLLLISGVSAAK